VRLRLIQRACRHFGGWDREKEDNMSTLTLWNAPLAAGFTPAAEIVRDGDDAVVRVELPGIDVANDVTVEIADGRLVVRGERKDVRSSEQGGRSLREVRYGSFRRSFGLPAGVDADQVTAGYDAGVLSVRVPGVYAGRTPRRIEIAA
jgi:HSP20 family protein